MSLVAVQEPGIETDEIATAPFDVFPIFLLASAQVRKNDIAISVFWGDDENGDLLPHLKRHALFRWDLV